MRKTEAERQAAMYSLLGKQVFERYFTDVLSDPPIVAHVIARGILRKPEEETE